MGTRAFLQRLPKLITLISLSVYQFFLAQDLEISSSVLPLVSGSHLIPKNNEATQTNANNQKAPATEPKMDSDILEMIGKEKESRK